MAKLSELGIIITGNTPKTSDTQNYVSNDICFVKPSDIADGEITDIEESEFHISEYARANARILPPNCVMVTCIGSVGKVAVNKVECAFNQQINAIIPNHRKCVPEYLAFAILNRKEELQNTANAAVVPILNKKQFSEIEIDIPSLAEQEAILAKMKAVCQLITLRKEQLTKLDQLVKARFVEMFGDPVANEKKWPLVTLSEIAEIKIGPFGTLLHKEDYLSGGHALVNPSHIIDGKIVADENLTISDEKYAELSAYHLLPGDIVMGRRGEMGRCAVVYESGLLCGTGSLIIRPNENMSPYFLQSILSSPGYKKIIEDKAVGVTMPNLNVPIVSSLILPQLPVDLQKDFIRFMEKTDETKLTIQSSLDKLEVMKKALMQEYFG